MASSYTLKFYPKPSPTDEIYRNLLESIPSGKFYQLAPITVPLSPNPQPFIIHTDAWDRVIKVSVNNREQARLVPFEAGRIFSSPDDILGFHMEVEVGLILDQGQNYIHVEIDNGQNFDLFAISSSIASLFKGYSQTLFDSVLFPLQKEKESILSPWSPKVMEGLLRFHDQLPDLRIPKTHAIKLAVRAMMAFSGTNIGVRDFATALTYNHPLIREVTAGDFPDLNYYLELGQSVRADNDFHTWVPSPDTVSKLAFGVLTKNLPRVWDLKSLGEAEIDVVDISGQDRLEQHVFSGAKIGPDFYGLMQSYPRMQMSLSTSKRTFNCIGLYNYRYPLHTKVLYPLGSHLLGRRPRECGSAQAGISVSGTVTPVVTAPLPATSTVSFQWGVYPSGADVINTVGVADDKDISYIYHSGGGSATSTFRFDLSSVPADAVITKATLRVSARGVGTSPSYSMISVTGGTETTLATVTPTENYTVASGDLVIPSQSVSEVSSISFGVKDLSGGSSFVRVTMLALEITWTRPFTILVGSTLFTIPLDAGTGAFDAAYAVGYKIYTVSHLLGLYVSLWGPEIFLAINQILDMQKTLRVRVISIPLGLSVSLVNHGGHMLGQDNGVDTWATIPRTQYHVTAADFPSPYWRRIPGRASRAQLTVRRFSLYQDYNYFYWPTVSLIGTPTVTGLMRIELKVTSSYVPTPGVDYIDISGLGGGPDDGCDAIRNAIVSFLSVSPSSYLGFASPRDFVNTFDGGGNLLTSTIYFTTEKEIGSNEFPFSADINVSITGSGTFDLHGFSDGIGDSWISVPTYVDQATGIRSPRTYSPEIGFFEHSLMSTRGASFKQISAPGVRTPGYFGSMTGYFPSSKLLNVGSIVAISKTFSFPSYTFTADDIGRVIRIDRSTYSNNQQGFTITGIVDAHTVQCGQAYGIVDELNTVVGRLLYRCQEPRPPRVRGPQAVLLTTSRLDQNGENLLDGFVTRWTLTGDLNVTLPVSGPTDFRVDWGDGSPIEDNVTTHTYASSGTYDIIIGGECPRWMFGPSGSNKIVGVVRWGRAGSFAGFTDLNFYGCSSLSSLPNESILPHAFGLTSLANCFRNTVITTIPVETFALATDVTDFNNCFRGCWALTTVDGSIFASNGAATNFSECFRGASNMLIPAGLFDHNSNVTDFSWCFSEHGGFMAPSTTIPAGLFDHNPLVTTFAGCFSYYPSLASIPSGLFDHNPEVTDFSSCFMQTNRVAAIPAGLFDHNPKVTTFAYTFDTATSVPSIPAGLFDHNPLVTTFYRCFDQCYAVHSIPADLFKYNTEVIDFGWCFSQAGIYSIPAGLFDTNTKVTSFNQCFGYTGIASIPAGLFANNTEVTNFANCFDHAQNLASIPAGLFSTNTKVTTFEKCFYYDWDIVSLPVGLFSNNTLVTTFAYCFAECQGLTTLPASLFANNTNATNFDSCFYNCPYLRLRDDMFYTPGAGTNRFLNQSVNFYYCFVFPSIWTSNRGTAPDIWNCNFGTGTPVKTMCFGGGANAVLTNYASIPVDWRT